MKSISVILFLLTLLSAVYLLASPHRQSVAGDVIQSEAYHEQAGEYRRGWPFPYLTYKAEHGDSKTTYYDFSYTYQPMRPFALFTDVLIFGMVLLALVRFPVISARQLWWALLCFLLVAFLLSSLIPAVFNEHDQNGFIARVLGPERMLHLFIFSVLAVSLFFVLARLVAMLSFATPMSKGSGGSTIAG